MKIVDRNHVTSSHQRFFKKFEKTGKKTFTYEWKMTALAVLSYSVDEIMKMYGGIFSVQIHWEVMNNFEFRDQLKKLRLLITSKRIKISPYIFIISSKEYDKSARAVIFHSYVNVFLSVFSNF